MSASVSMDVVVKWSLPVEGRTLHWETRVFSVAADQVAWTTTVADFGGLARVIGHSTSVYVGLEIRIAGCFPIRVGGCFPMRSTSVTVLTFVIGSIFVVVVVSMLVLEYMAGQHSLVQRVH
jgi:hypothetical protein